MIERTCTICGLSFPATPEYFYRYKQCTGKYSIRGECKECTKLLQRKRDFKNRFINSEKRRARYNAMKMQLQNAP